MKQLFNWLRLRKLDHDLDRELAYHIDRRTSDLMASGLSEGEARRQAAMEVGYVAQVQEEVRDVWLTRWLRDFVYDLRYSARAFRRSPSFTATAVLSLALGIGATTAIYSLVDQVILHSLPVRDPQRLVLIDWPENRVYGGFGSYNLMSYPLCQDLQKQNQFFDGVLCRAATSIYLSTGGDSKPAAAEIVSANYFSVLGVQPALGRLLSSEDDQAPGTDPVVVLSHEFWQAQFAGAPDVIGRTLLVNRHPMTVIGVAAEGFRGIDVGQVPTLWIPTCMSGYVFTNDPTAQRSTRWMQVLGRLRPDVTLEQAKVGLDPWFKATLEEDTRRAEFPKITAERRKQFLAGSLRVTPAPQGHSVLHRTLTQPLWVLFSATGVLLALACLNVAGLFLARGSARDREITTRFALGASRGRIGRQLVADSMLLALTGGILGVLVAPLAIRALIAFLPRDAAANALQSTLDWRLLGFAFLVSVITGLLTALGPALSAGRSALISTMKERGGTGSGGLRLRRVIVTAQIAFTLILVIGAALFSRTLNGLLAKGPGFATTSLVSFSIDPVKNGYSRADANRLVRNLHEELKTAGNSQSAGIARYQLLTGGSWNNPITIQARERTITDRDIHLNAISPEFFATLGAKIISGRGFDERDSRPVSEGGRQVAIVNEAFATRYLPGQNAVGALIAQGSGPDVRPDTEIVGVVSNISYRGLRGESEQAYFPMRSDEYSAGANFYLRIRGSSDAAFQEIRSIVRKADPTLSITYMRTLDEQVSRSLSTERMLATLSESFGSVALMLSLVGLYGVMSFVVTQRTREIGIRMALGATSGSAVWLILRDALIMLTAGIAIALPSVWALGRLIEAQLYDVRPTDPGTIAVATLVLCSGALGAALVPARRASGVNPTDALRFE